VAQATEGSAVAVTASRTADPSARQIGPRDDKGLNLNSEKTEIVTSALPKQKAMSNPKNKTERRLA
jgi:hypothetical protein